MSKRRRIPKEKQQKIVLVGILVTMGLAVMWMFWVDPKLTAASNSRNRIANLQTEIEEAQRRQKQESLNQPMLQQITAFLDPLRGGMVTDDPYMWVVRQLSQLVRGRAVRMPTPRPGLKTGHQRVAGVEIVGTTVEWEGSYDQIGELISEFENRFPFAEIRRVEFGPGDNTSLRRRATVELQFVVWPGDKLKLKEDSRSGS